MKPIETIYNGYRFRSRLEARWAVFYAALGIPYQYEMEGFDLGGIWYLPDFYLPDQDYWIEVKPREPNPSSLDYQKVARLATSLGKDVYVAIGSPWFPFEGSDLEHISNGVVNYHRPVHPGGNVASHHWWIQCPTCGRLALACFGDLNMQAGGCNCRIQDGQARFMVQGDFSPAIDNAYTMARQARFENGIGRLGKASL